MAKTLKTIETVSINNSGISASLSIGYKMAFIPITLEDNDGKKTEGITITYKGFAQSFAVVVNTGSDLFAYALPATTIAGLFSEQQEFAFVDGTTIKSNSPLIAQFDNAKIFRTPQPLKSFVLTASAFGQLLDRRKDKTKGKVPPTWTMWGVKSIDDAPTIADSTISWGGFALAVEEVAEKVAKSHDTLIERISE